MEQDEIIEKIKRYMEEKLSLEYETCYFLTKKLNEEYWELLKEPEEEEEPEPEEDEDEFADFEGETKSEEVEEEPELEEDLDVEEEIDIGNGKKIRKPPQPPLPPPEMSTRPKIKVYQKKPSLLPKTR